MKKLIAMLFLAGSLGTYILPVIVVNFPPLGQKAWSVLDVTKPVAKALTGKRKEAQKGQFPGIKVDQDFLDLLKKIAPKSEASGEPQKFSLPYILGILVPVSLILAYLLAALGLLSLIVGIGGVSRFFSFLALVNSAYALVGTFYLGKAAAASFQQSVEKASQGIFGAIAQNFAEKVTVEPDKGLFMLVVLTALSFAALVLAKKK
ncbi:MAG: hypothetical protein HY447_01055 [Candidatus Omnitrophica bacterium]|nr:hypothetical protein [Candidatus Omnitrophota bacterium]